MNKKKWIIVIVVLALVVCGTVLAIVLTSGEKEETATNESANKNVTWVADELGLSNEQAVDYTSVGAIDGKSYSTSGGQVTIYQMKFGTAEYDQAIANGKIGDSRAAAFKGGFALVFQGEQDDDLVNKFKGLF